MNMNPEKAFKPNIVEDSIEADKSYDNHDEIREMQEIMYEIPGFGEPNIDRYLKARNRERDELERLTLKFQLAECTTSEEQFALLEGALSSKDLRLQKTGIELVEFADSTVQEKLSAVVDEIVLTSLTFTIPEDRLIGARMLKYVSGSILDQVESLIIDSIEQYFESDDSQSIEIAAQMIQVLAPSDKTRYELILAAHIKESSGSNVAQQQVDAAYLIKYLSKQRMPEYILNVLEEGDMQAQEVVVEYIKRFKPVVAEPLIRQAFQSNDLHIREVAAEAVTRIFRTTKNSPGVPADIQAAIITTVEDVLNSEILDSQILGAKMLKDIPNEHELARLIEVGMGCDNDEVRVKSIKAIKNFKAFQNTREQMTKLVMDALGIDDREMQKAAVAVARHVPHPEKVQCYEVAFQLVERLLQSEEDSDRRDASEMLYYIDHPQAHKLFQIIEQDQQLLDALMYARLYPYDEELEDSEVMLPTMVNFAKTGSEMTVLRGGNLEKRLLIRHIKKQAFLGWMKAFEDHETWLDAGFDYVPVEPIQSFMFQEQTVDVYAGVFDFDLKHWLSVTNGRFKEELLEQRETIKKVLQSMGIRHGDLHEGNFFLKFLRDEEGNIDTSICPRIYVGDFDKSQMKVKLKRKK